MFRLLCLAGSLCVLLAFAAGCNKQAAEETPTQPDRRSRTNATRTAPRPDTNRPAATPASPAGTTTDAPAVAMPDTPTDPETGEPVGARKAMDQRRQRGESIPMEDVESLEPPL